MNCPNCHQEVEAGAAFCGNCGQPLTQTPVPAAAPAYALSSPVEHRGETKALLALIIGIIALITSFIPALGCGLGIVALILGTMTRRSHHRTWSTIGMSCAALAIVAGLAFWAFAIQSAQKAQTKNHLAGVNTAAVSTAAVKTPCYDLSLGSTMNTDYDKNNSCDMRAYDGTTILASNDVYKVYANEITTVTPDNFTAIAKAALEKDVASTLPGFQIDSEETADFAGSPAYVVNASNGQDGIAVVEAAVMHKVASGYNLFSLVHATKGSTTDLKTLESQWQWK